MKLIYTLFIFVCFQFNAGAQYFLKSAGSAAIDEGLGITTTANGESYVTGYFSGAASFGNINLTTSGLADVFICKLGIAGNYVWALGLGGTGVDKGLTIAHANSGEIYVAGTFENSITIGSTTLVSSGISDIFILKISTSGTIIWCKKAGGSLSDFPTAITVDFNDNILLTGYFSGSAVFGIDTLTSTQNPANGNPSVDIFISKLESSGSFLWSKQGVAKADDRGFDIVTDTAAAIYLIAQFSDTITFDISHPNNVSNAICVVKFDSSGNELWFRKIVGGSTVPAALTMDAANHLIVVGNFTGNLNVFTTPVISITPTYSDGIFVAQFTETGNLDWLKSNSSSNYLRATDVVCSNSSIYVMGEYKCNMSEFSATYGSATFNSVGYSDVFLSTFDGSGNWQWAQSYGGTKDDAGNSLSIDANNEMYFTGSFEAKFTAPLSKPSACFNITTVIPYCNDSDYNAYCTAFPVSPLVGNRDVIVAKCFDSSRQPYDFYIHTDTVCERSIIPLCIRGTTSPMCSDTITICGNNLGLLFAYTGCNTSIGPKFNYLWSNGATFNSIQASSGTYTVTVTSEDGCISQTAQTYLAVIAPPAKGLFSDSKGINISTAFPQTINFCAPDSVTIWVSNIAPGYAHYWVKNGLPIYSDTITVYQTCVLQFVIGDTSACPTISYIQVHVSQPISGDYAILASNLVNQTDTVRSCGNFIRVSFNDSLTGLCYPDSVYWFIDTPCSSTNGDLPCLTTASNTFYPTNSGYYTISCFGISSVCKGDTIGLAYKTVYFESLIIPTVPSLTISGAQDFCLTGDTLTLTCSTSPNYKWIGAGIISNDTLQSVQINLPGTYSVSSTVFSVDGCSVIGTAFTQMAYKPNPQINVSPSDGIICPGDSVQLSCPNIGNYQWVGPAGNFASDTAIVYASQPGNYYCIVTDTTGCQLLSNSFTIELYSSPTLIVTPSTICNGSTALIQLVVSGGAWQWQSPLSGNNLFQIIDSVGVYECAVLSCNIYTLLSATITTTVFPKVIAVSGNTTICSGDSVMLTAPAGYTYNWFPNADTTQIIYAKDSGNYFVQLTDSMGCYDFTDSVFVQLVSPPPQPVILGNTTLCKGNDLSLTTSSIGFQYSWNGPSGFTATVSNPMITNVSTANSGSYFLIVINGGCSSDSASVTVTVNVNPAPPLVTSNNPLCIGDTLQLTANASSFQSFSWNGPTGFSSTLQNPVIANTTVAQSGLYSVIGYDGNCFSDSSFIIIAVLEAPPNPIISANSPLCEGSTLQFNTTSSSVTYNWNGPDGFSSTIQNPNVPNIQSNNVGVYNLIVSDGNCYSDTATYIVTVTPTPLQPFTLSVDSACAGSEVQLQATLVTGANYVWYGPSGFSSTLQNPIISNVQFANTGYYFVYTVAGLCNSLPDSIFITILASPQNASISGVATICENDSLILNANNASGYQWSGPDGYSSTQQQVMIYPATITNSGNYSLVVSESGCLSAATTYTVTVNALPPVPEITANAPICEGNVLQFSIVNPDALTYNWTGPNGFATSIINPTITNSSLSDSGTYSVVSFNGCNSNVAQVQVEINTCTLTIPNIFTPNGDGLNDYYIVESTAVSNIEYKIIDRWGMLVYSGSGAAIKWNGNLNGNDKAVPSGTYFYIFHVTFSGKPSKKITGYLELLR